MNAYHVGVNRPLGEMMPSGDTSAVLDYTSVMKRWRETAIEPEILHSFAAVQTTADDGSSRTCGDIESRGTVTRPVEM